MANDLASRQWRLDTPNAYGNAGSILWRGNVRILQIEFSNYNSQGNVAHIKDQTGRTVWYATGEADLSPIRSGNLGWANGLCLDTLDSGLVIVATG